MVLVSESLQGLLFLIIYFYYTYRTLIFLQMPKSRNRKDHKKKVQQRNTQIDQLGKMYQKMYNQKMVEHLKALHEEHIKNSGTTENDGPIQPTDSTEL